MQATPVGAAYLQAASGWVTSPQATHYIDAFTYINSQSDGWPDG